MTTELKKQFFDTFGIEKKQKCAKPLLKTTSGFCKAYKNCVGCDYNDLKYPQITDTHYLEMLCILGENGGYFCSDEIKKLKKETLKLLIRIYKDYVEMDYKNSDEWSEELKEKIQALFKGE